MLNEDQNIKIVEKNPQTLTIKIINWILHITFKT